MGAAAFVLGCCLGVGGPGRRPSVERALAVFFGAGTMTLTLYTLHVLMRTERVWPAEEPESFRSHVLVLMAIGAVFVAAGRAVPSSGWSRRPASRQRRRHSIAGQVSMTIGRRPLWSARRPPRR